MKKYTAEFIGTFLLLFGGIGSAVITSGFPGMGIGILGVALAVGLSITTMAFAFGSVSGAHFNPAVSIGLWAGGKFPGSSLPGYIIAQLLGGICGAGVVYFIANCQPGFEPGGFASNGFADYSPGKYSQAAVLLAEVVGTFIFVTVILQVTRPDAPAGFAPIAIGLTLTVICLAIIPVSNGSVNPARSTATAIFAGGWALEQLWLFWVAPVVGGLLAGLTNKWFNA